MSRSRGFAYRFSLAAFAAFAFLIARCVHADGVVTVSPSSIVQSAAVNGTPIVVTITVTNNTSSFFETPVGLGRQQRLHSTTE